ncbi:Six-hairpin glycosidase [Chlorella sorokiniana]|uniref:D-ribulose kinase n=1 Tax=Chlorella sorokiniana TaxID=3076 RepID=A0A2P6TSB3_CHLSO|nr:Six-hairpin glycosidase [Chlorella sorokiniana]|eukprot:PRW56955.1 Six-hairpin glycosidase [Chlorella sorokiniana]
MYNEAQSAAAVARAKQLAPEGHTATAATSTLCKVLEWDAAGAWQAAAEQGLDPAFVHQADWVAGLLHGQWRVSDYNNALKLGYDPGAECYPEWLASQPFAHLLPVEVVAPGTPVAPITEEAAERSGLPRSCMVCGGTTDSIAAFLAAGVTQPGEAVTSLGSTLAIKLLSQTRVEDDARYGLYSHRLGSMGWLVGGASNTGGAVLRQHFSDAQLTELTQRMDPEQPTGLDYYPLTAPGERFPVNDPQLQPRLEPRPADDAQFLQGIFESIARIEAQAYRLLADKGATPVSKVYTAGGGAKNPVWTAIRQRELGVPVVRSERGEAAYGAAVLARQGARLGSSSRREAVVRKHKQPVSIGWLSLRGRGEPAMATAAPPTEAAAPDKAAAAADTVYTNPLASHALPLDPPAAMLAGKEAAMEPLPHLPSPISSSSIGAPSSSGGGSSSGKGGGGGGGGGGDRHLRKLTQSLVEVLETMSSNVQPAPGHRRSDSRGGSRRHTLSGLRDDSVVDLEAGRAALLAQPPASGSEDGGVVPVAHVRRLTTTLVDILRHVASGQQRDQQQGVGRDPEIVPEGAGLLGESQFEGRQVAQAGRCFSMGCKHLCCGGELSYSDDKLSLASAGTASTAGGTTSKLAPLLFVKDEYRGDDVKPFFVDQPLLTAASRKPEDLEDPASLEAGAEAQQRQQPDDGSAIPHRLVKKRAVNWWGLTVYLFFIAVFCFYIWARAAHTLGLGPMLWYGAIVLAVEILGGLAMLPYGLCLVMRVTNNGVPPPDDKGQVRTALNYHIRVVVPCYKEPLDVIQKTVTAALVAPIPTNCSRTVYLLDDGRDVEKKKFIHSLGVENAVYVSGRKRAKGEMNGKSANINNAAKQIYPAGHDIPLTEVLCVFDADQVPNADFFLKTVPLLDGGQDVGMVLTPQAFYNLNPGGDIFNHSNVHFWDYTQPGYDALGLISCTGTNFLVRAKAFYQAGWFPEWTLTEDFALGIELKKLNWQCRYVDEYLAIGEAPEEVRNCFQQRSRWAKGHFQVFFSGHNPVFARGLSPLMRWMYGTVVLSYFSAFLSTPLLMLVPMITVWLGSFPIVINFWAAVSITVYYAATLGLMYYTRALAHLKSMWFSSVANSILWFAFLKAMYRATLGRWIDGKITFKVTAKGLQRIADLPIRDVWIHVLFFTSSLVCLIFGLVHFFRGPLDTPLAISLIFMVYNIIPQFLLLQYVVYRKPLVFNAVCKLAMLLSTAVLILGVVLVWLLYPRSYDYKQALGNTMLFFDSQREGYLPLSTSAAMPWRGPAFTADYNTSVTLASSLPNGTLDGFGALDTFGDFGDLFGRRLFQADAMADPFAAGGATGASSSGAAVDPFAAASGLGGDPFAAGSGSGAGGGADPFAAGGSGSADPFATSTSSTSDAAAAAIADVAWDLGGGWMSGMAGAAPQSTMPSPVIALLQAAGQAGAALDSIRWGSDYLLKVHKALPESNTSLLVTRVGDIDTEMLLWYRPEEQALPRPAYAVDLTTGGSDLGGSVTAALAAASMVFRNQNDTDYAKRLLDKAQEVYSFSKEMKGKFGDGDFNLTVLYNTSTYYDDLAWGAGWLYKATKQDSYLSDVYEFYMKHLEDEGPIADFKYAYDWDNVFYPLNLLLAQETDRSTFRERSEQFLRNWICAGNAANYTARGRAYNPMSGSLGATANAATLSLMYADMVERSSGSLAREYRCWGLSQIRYMLGDAGRSLLVGYGRNPPKRTQDRGAACPDAPEVCNRVTGLLSPDPDAHVLKGALVYGSGRSDDFEDKRDADSNWVGVENNAGLAAALAGVMELDPGLWEVCLQDYGIYRQSAICGKYLTV